MLVTLLPEQVSDMWPILKGHIEDSMPPTGDWGPYDINNVLFNLLAGYAQIWLFKNSLQENQGFVTTTIMTDISGVRTLLIYNIIVIDKSAKVNWMQELETLKKYAHSRGCSKIGSFVMNQKALDILKEHDVETRFTFAHINI